MNQLELFQHEIFGDVRTSEDEKGVPLFCASDVARALGYAKPNNAILRHCKNIVKQGSLISGKIQEINFLYEPDVYRLVTNSKLPTAQEFERYIFEEVLPNLRKKKYHFTAESLFTTDGLDRFIEWVEEMKREQEAYAKKSNGSLFQGSGFTMKHLTIDPNNDPE
ncbi:MAG: BRO family protein [Eubacteriales bacterium]